jgi:acyl carrier protein
MIPSAIVPLEKLPLNTNGKVDRKALPAPELVLTKKKAYVAPSTPTQQVLVTIWTEILKVDPISIDDNFFDLGGHSLMATQVVSRIREHFSVEIALRVIFETPTIQGIALAVEMAKENGEEADLIVPVSRSAYRRAAQTDK